MKSSTPSPSPVAPDSGTHRVSSEVLLAGRRELVIRHAGADYRLRVTRQGKLLLTK